MGKEQPASLPEAKGFVFGGAKAKTQVAAITSWLRAGLPATRKG